MFVPELPEVETIRRELTELEGREIRSLVIHDPMLLGKGLTAPEASDQLRGKTIRSVERIGKYFLLSLEDSTILFSLRMTGTLNREKSGDEDRSIIFDLDRGHLEFRSVRRFSRVHYFETTDLETIDKIRKLGLDPLHDEPDLETVRPLLQNRTAPIKTLLMNQEIFAGMGNIYASEACFVSGIDPRRSVRTLSEEELEDLLESMETVLEKAIGLGGSSISDFTSVNGENGSYQDHFFVYGRDGEECRSCGETIRKTELAGRSTFWCPACQNGGNNREEDNG